eukprot:CAMPEP_0118969926 /NCGR_PEP_ID=MMETSP1173-20130426/6934_1 /TAXON_ID=1034831 /ORGANISM="Rhizochromulina marina cf, Strain CCMP1243" /LENGTH=83 /DNA_ID=CAMNT_0006919225 /DNA_START=45 /DNA_END=293 /DNA_ORIENTATION=+
MSRAQREAAQREIVSGLDDPSTAIQVLGACIAQDTPSLTLHHLLSVVPTIWCLFLGLDTARRCLMGSAGHWRWWSREALTTAS